MLAPPESGQTTAVEGKVEEFYGGLCLVFGDVSWWPATVGAERKDLKEIDEPSISFVYHTAVKTPSMAMKKKKVSSSTTKRSNKNWSCVPRNLDVGRSQRGQFLKTLEELAIHDPIFLLEKNITDSDINKQQNRLLIPYDAFDLKSSPFSMLVNDNERDALKGGEALNINIIDQSKRKYSLTLKYLDSNKAFRIIGADWSNFVYFNTLKRGQNLELWGVRRETNEALCFAMFNYDFPTQDVIEAAKISCSISKKARLNHIS